MSLVSIAGACVVALLFIVGSAEIVRFWIEDQDRTLKSRLAEELAAELHNRLWQDALFLDSWIASLKLEFEELGYNFSIRFGADNWSSGRGPPPSGAATVSIFAGIGLSAGLTRPGWLEVSVW
jgi:hypothetical protein